MKKHLTGIAVTILLILSLLSCQKEDVRILQSMEEFQADQGIPVTIQTIEEEDITTSLTYTAAVTAEKESSASALISDTIEEVLFSLGDEVSKGDIIIRFPRDNASANYYQSLAGYQAAQSAFERIEVLYANEGVSKQTYDEVKTQWEVQKANFDAVQKLLEVTAPIDGIITRLDAGETDNVYPGKPLFTVSDYDHLKSRVLVSSNQISAIQTGAAATALWQGKEIYGEVTQVALAMDPQMKAFTVLLSFDNSEHLIPSGVSATLTIETATYPETILVHRDFLHEDAEGTYVFIEEEGIALRRNVETGIRKGMGIQITSGLSAGDHLILDGTSLVREGSPLYLVTDEHVSDGQN